MAFATTIYPAKVGLKTLLAAHFADVSWTTNIPAVRWGGPTDNEDFPTGGEVIYFGDTETSEDEHITLGMTRVDEHFSLPLVIDVRRDGDDEQGTEARAWTIYAGVINALRSDPTLGAAINRVEGYRKRPQSVPLAEQWLFRITVEIDCVGLAYY
jgi:hypothetical protein